MNGSTFVGHAVRVVLLAALLVGCGGRRSQTARETMAREVFAGGPPPNWPDEVIASTRDAVGRPALFLGPGPDAARIGFVSPRVRVKIAGAPVGERIPVRIDGPVRIRAWFSLGRVALRVQRRGRVRDTPTYVGPNDEVTFLGVVGARAMVRVAPMEGQVPLTSAVFDGSYPMVGLGADRAPDSAEAPARTSTVVLVAGTTILDAPGGRPVSVLPAGEHLAEIVTPGDPPLVRVGSGPYLIGYPDRATAELQDLLTRDNVGEAAFAPGSIPDRIRAEAQKPLLRLRPGARITFEGQTFAIFREGGYARDFGRNAQGLVDVYAAANNDVTVRGFASIDDLEAIEDPTQGDEGSFDDEPAAPPAAAIPAEPGVPAEIPAPTGTQPAAVEPAPAAATP